MAETILPISTYACGYNVYNSYIALKNINKISRV